MQSLKVDIFACYLTVHSTRNNVYWQCPGNVRRLAISMTDLGDSRVRGDHLARDHGFPHVTSPDVASY